MTTSATSSEPSLPPFLQGGGACGALIAARDWSGSPLGPVEGWPSCLRTALGLVLRSPVPMVLLWGEAGVMLYNDAYSGFAGGRHPGLLGARVREGWPEVAAFNDHVMRVGLGGGTLAYKDQELVLHRHGRPETVVMNLDYSPVPGEDGAPAGVLAVVVETTGAVMAERRLRDSEAQAREQAERAQLALDAGAIVGTWNWDLTNDRVTADERFAQILRTRPRAVPARAGKLGEGAGHRASRGQAGASWRPSPKASRAGDALCAPVPREGPGDGRLSLDRGQREGRPRAGRHAPALSGRASGRGRASAHRGKAAGRRPGASYAILSNTREAVFL